MEKDLRIAVFGATVIIRGCHNRDKGTAENERLRNPKFIFSYPKNERMIFLSGRNAAQEEISTVRAAIFLDGSRWSLSIGGKKCQAHSC